MSNCTTINATIMNLTGLMPEQFNKLMESVVRSIQSTTPSCSDTPEYQKNCTKKCFEILSELWKNVTNLTMGNISDGHTNRTCNEVVDGAIMGCYNNERTGTDHNQLFVFLSLLAVFILLCLIIAKLYHSRTTQTLFKPTMCCCSCGTPGSPKEVMKI